MRAVKAELAARVARIGVTRSRAQSGGRCATVLVIAANGDQPAPIIAAENCAKAGKNRVLTGNP